MNNFLKKPMLGLTLLLITGGASAQTCNSSMTETTPTDRFEEQDNGSTILDKQTQLIWKRCSEGQTWDNVNSSCTGVASTYTWLGALEAATTLNTTGGFASQTDWRVPNIKELGSIVELKCYSPAINVSVFPDTSGPVWSSSPAAAYSSSSAWYIGFYKGNSSNAYNKSNYAQVRLVRSGQ